MKRVALLNLMYYCEEYTYPCRKEMVKMLTRYKDLAIEEPDTSQTINTGNCGIGGDEVINFR